MIEVDPSAGAFTQRGFFQPVATEAGAAHWITAADGTEYIYSIDDARGIDILRPRPGGCGAGSGRARPPEPLREYTAERPGPGATSLRPQDP